MSEQYEIAIIGGGPAGLSAALTAQIRNKKVVVFEAYGFSDKLQKSHLILNYPGLPNVSGKNLMESFIQQAKDLHVQFIKEKVQAIYPGDVLTISTTQGNYYQAKSVIIATGTAPAILYPGEEKYLGTGVSYCATCDGMIYRDQEVAVIAMDPEAPHEAEFLAEICKKVHYFPLLETSHSVHHENIVIYDRKILPKEILGKDQVTTLLIQKADHTIEEIDVAGIFILRQATRLESFLHGLEIKNGGIFSDKQQATNIPGVFAAGDCTGKPWQLPRAVGEGNVAALAAVEWLGQN